jgi:hypothetical protein
MFNGNIFPLMFYMFYLIYRATVKCLCVLLPVMGVTWVIGLFYVNEDTNWIQYLFATVNSLQVNVNT